MNEPLNLTDAQHRQSTRHWYAIAVELAIVGLILTFVVGLGSGIRHLIATLAIVELLNLVTAVERRREYIDLSVDECAKIRAALATTTGPITLERKR